MVRERVVTTGTRGDDRLAAGQRSGCQKRGCRSPRTVAGEGRGDHSMVNVIENVVSLPVTFIQGCI